MSVAIKAHKAEKGYPARTITSHVGAAQEQLSSFLVDILTPYVKKSPFNVQNSTEFVEKVRAVQLGPDEVMISYDAEKLIPSVPIKDALNVIQGMMEEEAPKFNLDICLHGAYSFFLAK